MCGIRYVDNQLYVDGVSVESMAENIPTPFYVYSATRIQEKFNRLKSSLNKRFNKDSQPLIAYACKANSNISVLKLLASLGAGADVVTGGELQRALKAGIPARKIVFSGVGKTDEEIDLAIRSQILQINVESRPELERIATIAETLNQKTHVAFRVNPNVDAGTHEKITTGKKENKFGIPDNEILETYQWAHNNEWILPQGLSVHIGSQLTDVSPFRIAFLELAKVIQSLLDQDFPVNTIDVGGGLGIRYQDEVEPSTDEYASIIFDTLAHFNKRIICEPGRFIVGDSGAVISKITYLKKNLSGRNFLILDAGMNDLIRPTLYDTIHPVLPVNKGSEDKFTVDVVGPICETGDTFAKGMEIARVKQGDLIAIGGSGAYGAVMSSNYNTRGLTSEVLVSDDKVAIIRNAQTFEDMIANEQIPDWV